MKSIVPMMIASNMLTAVHQLTFLSGGRACFFTLVSATAIVSTLMNGGFFNVIMPATAG
jgi:hypothetical protein